MKRTWKIAALTGLLVATAALAAEVSIDYKRGTDFSKYKTFAWQEGVPAADPSMHKFILAKIEAALAGAGYTKVDSLDTADLHVLYSVDVTQETETEKVERRSIVTGLPKWDYSSFVDQGTLVDHRKVTQGSLTVDVEEGSTGTLLWSGVASSVLLSAEPAANQKKVEEAVRLLFMKFPPKPSQPVSK